MKKKHTEFISLSKTLHIRRFILQMYFQFVSRHPKILEINHPTFWQCFLPTSLPPYNLTTFGRILLDFEVEIKQNPPKRGRQKILLKSGLIWDDPFPNWSKMFSRLMSSLLVKELLLLYYYCGVLDSVDTFYVFVTVLRRRLQE